MKKSTLAAALLLLGVHGSTFAAGICTVVVDGVNWYISEPFPYTTTNPDQPYFDDGVSDTPHAKDFEAYVRRTYGIRGDAELHCHVYQDGEAREEGTRDVFGTTFRYVQTGYAPKGG
jgi:hypothetical protein